jgi:hypothetical protein
MAEAATVGRPYLSAWQTVINDGELTPGETIAQAAGQFDGALRGLRREPMRLNGADADLDVLRVRTMSPHRDSRRS